MTSRKRSTPFSDQPLGDDDSISEWLLLNKTWLGWTVVIAAVAIGGLWFFQRSRALKEQHAETAYYQARREEAAGNPQLAQSDLRKMADRYAGTRAGTQGKITLVQMLYDQGKFKEGVAELSATEKTIGNGDDFAPSVHLLEGQGYEQLRDFAHAADQYRLAAEATRFPGDRAEYRTFQARALAAAGKRDEALAIWQDLSKDEASPYSLEAKLRVGELQATPAKI